MLLPKGIFFVMKEIINSLEEELKIVNCDFEHLNMIYQSSNHECKSSKPTKCENCEVL